MVGIEAASITTAPAPAPGGERRRYLVPICWGALFGVLNAGAPIAFWWLTPAAAQALIISFIAAVYVGFAVADGRTRVIAAEVTVASLFVVLAAVSVTSSPWFLAAAYAGHGLKDLWQERHKFVANTRWWPPFCAAVDWIVAAVLVVMILSDVNFHR